MRQSSIKTEQLTQSCTYFVTDADILISKVMANFNIHIHLVKGKSRQGDIVKVRHLCIYFLCEKFNNLQETDNKYLTLKQIAKYFNRDHSTIIHAREAVRDRMHTDKAYNELFNKISEKIN